jgi:flagellar motor switch protein FliG
MFTFEDLNRLDSAGLQVLLRSVEKERLALALKGAPEELREMFFRNMTERAAKLLRDDIAGLGPVRLKDVDEAQAAVVTAAKDLAAQGQIQLSEGKEDQLVD